MDGEVGEVGRWGRLGGGVGGVVRVVGDGEMVRWGWGEWFCITFIDLQF
jgi:hypothetical protein